ncbi:hypothetical protein [Mycolicibacterium mageritense]|uniref:hypothetical protein n=1 Tax=Mycolicibacterium mageritense TaxID=53462 RepID=UPI001E3A437E|nr:hypothetical protein [Mycolicibacterium mageritense]GJJ19722.1 hypothetical protein MTY414_33950 [Mycolicibacterium mageritense]
MQWAGLREVSLMTTSQGPVDEDVFVVLRFDAEPDQVVGLSDADGLLPRLQELPGFDNEAFIEAMGMSVEGVSVLWRRGDHPDSSLD